MKKKVVENMDPDHVASKRKNGSSVHRSRESNAKSDLIGTKEKGGHNQN